MMARDPRYASFIPQQPNELRQCQCNQAACGWLTRYSIKALHGFTGPHVCRSRDSLLVNVFGQDDKA